MVTLFLQVKGFALKYHDAPFDPNIKKWNVKILEVNRHQRHMDKTIYNEFWTELERFMFTPKVRS